jgi:hypothetical protein
MADIVQVAGQWVTSLFTNQHVHLFRLTLPPGETLPDHDTGPRVIVLLTELCGRRVADGSEVRAPSGQALYLDNRFAGAMTNEGAELSYLVLSLTAHSLQLNTEPPVMHPALACVFNADLLNVLVPVMAITLPVADQLIHHTHQQNTARLIDKGSVCHCEPGDYLFFLTGQW